MACQYTRLIPTMEQNLLRLWRERTDADHIAAMASLDSVADAYGADDARSIVLYFLSNATTWRGEDARRIKAELKAALKG